MPKNSLNVVAERGTMTFSPPKNPGRNNSGSRFSRFPSANCSRSKTIPFKVLDDESMTAHGGKHVEQYGVLCAADCPPTPGRRLRDHLRAPPAARRTACWAGHPACYCPSIWMMMPPRYCSWWIPISRRETHPAQRTGFRLQDEAGSNTKSKLLGQTQNCRHKLCQIIWETQ